MVSTLRNLARDGRTVIASIHQPSSEVFELFDNLTLLSGGRLVYFGEAKAAREVSMSIEMAQHGFIISVICDDGQMFSLMSTFQPCSPTMSTLVFFHSQEFLIGSGCGGLLQHFAASGFPCPALRSPSDHFLRAINADFDQVKASLQGSFKMKVST